MNRLYNLLLVIVFAVLSFISIIGGLIAALVDCGSIFSAGLTVIGVLLLWIAGFIYIFQSNSKENNK